MFLSVSLRYLINVESLNGVESVGNISRHRSAPMVVPTGNGSYAIKYVPAISGESIAHAYQCLIVDEAKKANLPVGKYSSECIFLKFTDDDVVMDEGISISENARDMEVKVMLKDVVADIGGFLYAGKKVQVKRPSTFQVSYMVPAYDEGAETAALESQFHVRMSPTLTNKQIPYNVEVGSALYTLTFNLDLDRISVPFSPGSKVKDEETLMQQRDKRVEVAKLAMYRLLENLDFGAKRSRFNPIFQIVDGVAVASDKPFSVTPGVIKTYIVETVKRANALKSTKVLGEAKVATVKAKVEGVMTYDTVTEMIKSVLS
jgi:CRISPR-associated protein Csa2